MSNRLSRMLSNSTASIRETNDPLAKFLRIIFAELGISPAVMSDKLSRFLDDPANGQISMMSPESRTKNRGNIIKELSNNKLTWAVFMKGLKILEPEHVELIVNLHWGNKVTVHAINIPIKSLVDIDLGGSLPPIDETPVQLNGRAVTNSVPPLSESRWSAMKMGHAPGAENYPMTVSFGGLKEESKEGGEQ